MNDARADHNRFYMCYKRVCHHIVTLCKYEGYWQMADGSTVAVAGYNQNMTRSRGTEHYSGEPFSVKESFHHLDIFYRSTMVHLFNIWLWYFLTKYNSIPC